jgi:hypothetical protein
VAALLAGVGISLVACSGDDGSAGGCELTCDIGNTKGFESSLSCGSGAVTQTNSNRDRYARPRTVSFRYANGKAYSCDVEYDVLGFATQVSCAGECSSCEASR